MMEETILIGDDLMMGPPSPLIPPKLPLMYSKDEIAIGSDKELREQLQDSERKLGSSMPLDEANERATQLQSEVTSLDRHLILANGIEDMDGFHQRWSLHGHQ
ncbi:unnamed protein product [Camellia sinensis]